MRDRALRPHARALWCATALLAGCAELVSPCTGASCGDAGSATDDEPAPVARTPKPTDAGTTTPTRPPTRGEQCPVDFAAEGCAPPTDAALPAADATVAGEGEPTYEDGLECYRILARDIDGSSRFKVGIALDAYYMRVVLPPWKQTLYGVVVRPIIDNQKILHHWLLYQDNIATPPTPPVLQIGAHPTGQLIAGWAPGGDIVDFRESGADVALELPATTSYTLELHYNSSDLAAEDASGVEICGRREKTANVASISWLGYDQLGTPATKWTGTCVPLSLEPIHITHVWPHMHLTGVHMKATINRVGGQREILHDEPFDFNYQRSYKKNVTLMPGDTVTTECTYSKPALFGQPTNFEMCYLFTTAYPKGALQGPDLWGTVAHGTSSCLGM